MYAIRSYYVTNEGGVDGTIRFLKNIMGLWLIQECKRQWDREGEDLDYSTIVKLAAEAKPFTAVINPNHDDFIAVITSYSIHYTKLYDPRHYQSTPRYHHYKGYLCNHSAQ